MAINLTKGQTINLDKDANDLSSITIGLGWKLKKKPGFFTKLFGGGDDDDFDLDAIAFLLDENRKVREFGDRQLRGSDVVHYNNLHHPSGHVVHTGDNLQGGAGVQDDEQIIIKLNALSPQYHTILILVCIYEGIKKRQHFGDVEAAFIRAVDAKGTEILRYNLADDPAYMNMRTMVFAEVYRKDGGWKFRALGDSYPTDTFVPLLQQHA